MIDFNKTLFRCSSIGDLMTESKGKSNAELLTDAKSEYERLTKIYEETANKKTAAQENRFKKINDLGKEIVSLEMRKDEINLGDTCTKKLKEIYRSETTGRRKLMSNKYIEKGLKQEEDALTLYSLQKGKFYAKNTLRIENEFITGEVDFFDGPSLREATRTIDTKCSWDIFTLPFADEKMDKDYYWQGQGYMALTGATMHTVAYCLVNAPASLVEQAIKSLWYKMGCPPDEDPEFIAAAIEVEKNMIFSKELFDTQHPHYEWKCQDWTFDIPAADRLVEFHVERDESAINRIYERAPEWRKYLKSLK